MNNEELKEAIENVKKNSPKRKFNQSYDLIINIKNLDLKKTENHVDLFVHLNHERGKKIKIWLPEPCCKMFTCWELTS